MSILAESPVMAYSRGLALSEGEHAGMRIAVGGERNAGWPLPCKSISTMPIAHSCRTRPDSRGCPPLCNQAAQLPSVGWPVNSISRMGLKIRTR